MAISTGALTVDRIAAFRDSEDCVAFVNKFASLGFTCRVEQSRATCGFFLVHYCYRPIFPLADLS